MACRPLIAEIGAEAAGQFLLIDLSERNDARAGEEAHIRDERLGRAPVAPGAVEPLPQVSSQANRFGHTRPQLVSCEATLEDESGLEETLQKILRIVFRPYRFQQIKDLVLAVCAVRHTP